MTVAFRAALLVLALLQLTGVGHLVADLVGAPDDSAAHLLADDDGDCPPGCPSCHHANGGVGAPPRAAAPAAARPSEPVNAGVRLPNAWILPQGPDLPSIFRPPRRAGSFA